MKIKRLTLIGGSLQGFRVPTNALSLQGAIRVNEMKELETYFNSNWTPLADLDAELFSFTSVVFTTVKSANDRATYAEARQTYAGQDFLRNTDLFNVVSGEIRFTVPQSAVYQFDVQGAGAENKSINFAFRLGLRKGEKLRIIPGQQGGGSCGHGATIISSESRGLIAIVGGAGSVMTGNTAIPVRNVSTSLIRNANATSTAPVSATSGADLNCPGALAWRGGVLGARLIGTPIPGRQGSYRYSLNNNQQVGQTAFGGFGGGAPGINLFSWSAGNGRGACAGGGGGYSGGESDVKTNGGSGGNPFNATSGFPGTSYLISTATITRAAALNAATSTVGRIAINRI